MNVNAILHFEVIIWPKGKTSNPHIEEAMSISGNTYVGDKDIR